VAQPPMRTDAGGGADVGGADARRRRRLLLRRALLRRAGGLFRTAPQRGEHALPDLNGLTFVAAPWRIVAGVWVLGGDMPAPF
jgi:hypothetical protein